MLLEGGGVKVEKIARPPDVSGQLPLAMSAARSVAGAIKGVWALIG